MKNDLLQLYVDSIAANGFKRLSNYASRICDFSEKCKDHFITQNLEFSNLIIDANTNTADKILPSQIFKHV